MELDISIQISLFLLFWWTWNIHMTGGISLMGSQESVKNL